MLELLSEKAQKQGSAAFDEEGAQLLALHVISLTRDPTQRAEMLMKVESWVSGLNRARWEEIFQKARYDVTKDLNKLSRMVPHWVRYSGIEMDSNLSETLHAISSHPRSQALVYLGDLLPVVSTYQALAVEETAQELERVRKWWP